MQKSTQNYVLFIVALVLMILFFDNGGVTGLVISGVIFIIYFYLFKNDVALAFVLCAVIISNPFYIFHLFTFGYPAILNFGTIIFFLSFLVILSPQIKEKKVDINLKRFLPILLAFVIYQFVVSFLLKVATGNFTEIIRQIYRQLPMYFGVFLIIPSYYIFLIDGKKFINAIAIASIVFSLAVIINLYTPIELFLVQTEYRNGAVRTFLLQCPLFYSTVYIMIASLTFVQTKKKHIHYYLAGVGAMSVPLIAMYRLELFTLFLTMLFVAFLVSKYINRNLSGFSRLFKIMLVLVALVLVLAPHIYHAMSDMYVKTFQELLGTGPVERGTTQTRTEHELPLHLSMIRENPITGNGWRKEWFSNFRSQQDWGLSDIPLTASIAMYGWLGMLIYWTRFFYLLPLSKRILKHIGKDREKINNNELLYILIIALRAYFIAMISFRLFYIGYELAKPGQYGDFGVLLGIYFASIHILERQNDK